MQVPSLGRDRSSDAILPLFSPIFVHSDNGRPVELPSAANLMASAWSISRSKRTIDFLVAAIALAALGIPILIVAALVRASSRGPAFFAQKRVGRGGVLFAVYKFRSMAEGSGSGLGLTRGGDRRITDLGRWIRRFKIDELPQFYNVLRGDMSLVGPRPKLPVYEPMTNMPYRPGITGAATLAFRNEEELLSGIHPAQIETFYSEQIKPLKVQIDAQYMSEATLPSDLRLIAATFFACFAPDSIPSASSLKSNSAEMLP